MDGLPIEIATSMGATQVEYAWHYCLDLLTEYLGHGRGRGRGRGRCLEARAVDSCRLGHNFSKLSERLAT